jgi:calcineurin-like phosphoesterase family protein
MTVYFTGDIHFNHKNILKYCPVRAFDDVKEMNNYFLDLYNNTFIEGDTIYNLGDIMMSKNLGDFEKLFSKIKNKIEDTHNILILGNHDYLSVNNYISLGYESVHTSLNINIDFYDKDINEIVTYPIFLAHDPAIATVLPENSIMIHGHIHSLYREFYDPERNVLLINVGTDAWNNKFVNSDDIFEVIKLSGFDHRRGK